ncbi:Hypothetical predicted protein [Mytilus galloprovincialis]|uniref:DZIP3-like HEPN domain-containing protein n=1 Tax=Mytilus galloprovincialis TaxID=29158 RepID=A0A8B6FZ66_MYTGA|nr:Hypothetical predicted protein [Mytilus galloprovincialis]
MLYRQIQKNLKQNPRKFDKLTHDERTGLNLLKNGSYGEIDFTTIYKLIRAFAVVDDPNQGWAKTPSASDTEIADDIERMRIIRNKIVHKIKAEVSKVEMNDLFTEITSIASRVDKYLGKQPGAGFEIEVSKYRTCPLDHHLEQKYTQALQEIENMKEQFSFEEVHFYYGNSFQTFVENVKQKLGKPGKKEIVIILEDIDGDEEKINQLNKMKKELSSSSSLIKFEGAYRGSLVMNILIDESVLITESQLGSALHSFLKQVFHGIDEDFSPEGVIHAALVAMEEKLDLEIVVEDNGWDTCFSETPEISNSLCLDIMVKDEFFETDLRMQRELQGFAQSLRRSNGSLKKTAVSAILSSRDSVHEVETKKPSLSTEVRKMICT